jgi:glyoxylase-like metal-dependent hydrolase (beta-lactamase superfamily II)
MQQLRPTLWTWTAPHPAWTEDEGGPEGWNRVVRSYAYDSGQCLVLIDPLAPPSLLEGLVESKDVAVLLTEHCHVRSTADCVERFGATVHAMKEAAPKLSLPAQAFEQGDTLPGGVVAQLECYPFEAIFWIPAERAIVVGDALVGGELGLHVQPESWHVEGTTPASFRDRLRPLLDLPIELVLLTHGDPVLADGREAVRAALDA